MKPPTAIFKLAGYAGMVPVRGVPNEHYNLRRRATASAKDWPELHPALDHFISPYVVIFDIVKHIHTH